MSSCFKILLFLLLLVIFTISVYGLLSKAKMNRNELPSSNEKFQPNLTSINSVDKLLIVTDSLCRVESSGILDTAVYVDVLGKLVENRFRRGLAVYTFESNWIAALLGKTIWSHFAAIVKPDDILKHEEGLCSQQTMVFMEALKRKGIPFRSVGLGFEEGPGHFLCEVRYNNEWHLYDVTLEPVWENNNVSAKSLDYYKENLEELYHVYDSIIPNSSIDVLLKRTKYGEPNIYPASKMLLFHNVSIALVWLTPFITGYLLFALFRRIKRP